MERERIIYRKWHLAAKRMSRVNTLDFCCIIALYHNEMADLIPPYVRAKSPMQQVGLNIWNSTIPWLINLTIVCPIQMAVLRNYPIFRFPSGTFDPWSQPKKWTTEMRELRRSTWRNRVVPWDVAEPKICHDLPVDNHRTLRAWQKGAIVRGQVGVGTIENKSNFHGQYTVAMWRKEPQLHHNRFYFH